MSVIQLPDSKRRQRGHVGATYCHWLRALFPPCVSLLVPHVDAVAWMERALPAEQAVPRDGNTLWAAEWRAAGGADGAGSTAQQGQPTEVPRGSYPFVELSAAAAIDAGRALEGSPVLFMGAVPLMADESALLMLLPQTGASGCYLTIPGVSVRGFGLV